MSIVRFSGNQICNTTSNRSSQHLHTQFLTSFLLCFQRKKEKKTKEQSLQDKHFLGEDCHEVQIDAFSAG